MQFAERLKQLREREHLSQSGLATAIGATRAAVNAWEMGISNPNTQFLMELARYFHVSVDYLLGLNNTEQLILTSLTEEEKKIILQLVHYFDKARSDPPYPLQVHEESDFER